MHRPHEHANVLHQAVQGLVRSLSYLVDRLREAVGSDAVAGELADVPAQAVRISSGRGPGKQNPRLKAALKASWARMTPAQRKARIAKMLAGRGLKPKRDRAEGARAKGRPAAQKKKQKQQKRSATRKPAPAPHVEAPVPPATVI
jgi:hypothetical protein